MHVCVCVWGCVCTRTRVFNAIGHRVICWGGSPVASGCLSCCAMSLRTGEAGGWASHLGRREPFYDTRAPSSQDHEETARRGTLASPKAKPSRGHCPPPSPPSPPPLLRGPSGSLRLGHPPGGVSAFVPCSRDHWKQEKKSASVPLHIKYLTIKTPYKNVKLFFGINVCTGKKRGMEHLIGSSKGEKKRLQS